MTLSDYFKTFLGISYLYGGKNPLTGIDCSGLVSWCLHRFGVLQLGLDAQDIYKTVHGSGTSLSEPKEGSLVFYGKSVNAIDHIAYALDKFMVIEAAGGDSSTTSLKEAQKRGACVRLSAFNYRKDLLGIIHPDYNGLNGILY